jgi:hypothetical protein
MARPRTTRPPGAFDLADMAAGSGLTVAVLEGLLKRDDAPAPNSGGGRGRGAALWDYRGFGRLAVAGGLFWSGAEPTPAMRIASAVVAEFESVRGPGKLSGLSMAWRDLPPAGLAELPSPGPDGWTDDYELYRVFRRHCADRLHEPWRGDVSIEIIDRHYVFYDFDQSRMKSAESFGVRRDTLAEPTFRLLGWERGGSPTLRHVAEEIPAAVFDETSPDHSTALAAARAVEDEFHNARANPRGALRLNMSRAIRCAYGRVYEFRNDGSVAPDTS